MVLHLFTSAASRDRFYIGFFLLHVISTIAVDLQPLLPEALRLELPNRLLLYYTQQTNDPLMLGALSDRPEFTWFRWFLYHEAIFLLPCLCLGIHGLLKGTPSIYPTLVAYGAAASTTTATCVVVLLFGDHQIPLTRTQLIVLLSAYVPYFLAPLAIFVDMLHRIHLLIDSCAPKRKQN